MDLALEIGPVLFTFLGIILAIVAIIVFMKMTYGKRSNGELAMKYRQQEGGNSRLMKKYPEADAFKWSSTFILLSLVVGIIWVILAFSWTTYDDVIDVSGYDLELPDDIEIEPPRTSEPPPPPPPPPPPVIKEVPEEEIEEEVTFEDMTVDEETAIEEVEPEPEPEPEPEAPPPPEPEPEEEEDEIFVVAEQMPRFPGCEDVGGTDADKKKCADKKMLEFIYKNIKYPNIARENGVQGTVVVRFVVGKDGKISAPQILRDIGAGCGKEALRILNLMNSKGIKWIPGRQRNRPVKVQFNLPVRFKLDG